MEEPNQRFINWSDSPGSVVFFPNDFDERSFLRTIEALADRSIIKASDKLALEYVITAKTLRPDAKTEEGVFVRIFDGFKLAENQPNPDRTSGAPFKLSEKTIYKRIKQYKDLGLFISRDNAHYSSKLDVLITATPRLTSIEEPKQRRVNTSESLAATAKLKQQKMSQKNTTFLSNETLKEMRSLKGMGMLMGRCVRPSERIKEARFSNVFRFPNQGSSNEYGTILVDTTSLVGKDPDVILTMHYSDNLTVEYVFSKINEQLTQGTLNLPLENKFRFDLVQVLKDKGLRDSGEYRRMFYVSFCRIHSTEFQIQANEATQYILHQLGFVNAEGEAYRNVNFRWFRILGENEDDSIPVDIETIGTLDEVPRFIDIALDDTIFKGLTQAIQQANPTLFLDSFERNISLYHEPNADFQWNLNSYLKTFVKQNENQLIEYGLRKFLNTWYPSPSLNPYETGLDRAEQNSRLEKLVKLELETIRYFAAPNRMIYAKDLTFNKRKNEPRVRRLWTFAGESFLVMVDNLTPDNFKFSILNYVIKIVWLSQRELATVKNRIAALTTIRQTTNIEDAKNEVLIEALSDKKVDDWCLDLLKKRKSDPKKHHRYTPNLK